MAAIGHSRALKVRVHNVLSVLPLCIAVINIQSHNLLLPVPFPKSNTLTLFHTILPRQTMLPRNPCQLSRPFQPLQLLLPPKCQIRFYPYFFPFKRPKSSFSGKFDSKPVLLKAIILLLYNLCRDSWLSPYLILELKSSL